MGIWELEGAGVWYHPMGRLNMILGDSSAGAWDGTAQQEHVKKNMCMALGRSLGGDRLTGACEEEYEYGTGQGPRRAKGS